MIYLITLLFIIYNIMVFSYSKSLYAHEANIVPYIIAFTPINFFILYASIYITEFKYDYIIMFSFLLMYTLEFKLLFKQSFPKIIFGTLSFALNIFAMRAIILAIISLVNQIPVSQAIQSVDIRLLTTAITLFLRPFTLRRAMSSVSKDQVFMIFSNKNNLLFSIGIFTIAFIYQASTSFLMSSQTNTLNTAIFLIGQGVFAIAIYIATMGHAYEFSRLFLHQKNFQRLKTEIKKEEKQLEKLKISADIDSFTQTHIRKIGEKTLYEYATTSDNFYVAYIDIDGLKIANDQFGHEEGDFYIQEVAKILTSVFSDKFVARMGGDEFLVLGTIDDEYEIAKKVLLCYEQAKTISQKFNKPYETSISYGVVEIKKKGILSAIEILALADTKMYDFKRARKKAR